MAAMATLMGLPMELLCQILEEVGGSHLRRGPGAARLCLSRKWYSAAHPVYLSGLGTTDVKIYGHNLDELEDKYGDAGLRHLMYKNTRSLRLRFLGHYWDQNLAATYDSEDEDGNSVDSYPAHNEAPFDFMQPDHQRMMEIWRDEKLKPRLDTLFIDLTKFSVLESLSLEASSDPSEQGQDGPHWDYLYQSSVVHLLQNLPIVHDLSSFTLDLCGMQNGLCEEQSHIHLCTTLAQLLPQIENVRIRLPSVCSSLFKLPPSPPSKVRLKTLILKLHMPNFAETRIPMCKLCPSETNRFIYRQLIKESATFLQAIAAYRGAPSPDAHGMTGFRISFKDPNGPCIATVDCFRNRYVFVPEDFYCYEDDGSPCWYELEPGRMLDGVPYVM